MGKIRKLKKALIKIHYQCNSNCIFCWAEGNRNSKPLKFTQIIKKIIQAQNLKADMIVLSGGEPLIHKDFFRVVDFLHQNKISWGIATNGRVCCYKKITEQLVKKGLRYVYFSLPSSNAQRYNAITRTPGSFEECIEGLNNLSRFNIELEINVPVGKFNLNDLKGIVDLVKDYKISPSRAIFSLIVPRGRALRNFKAVVSSLKKASESINQAIDYGVSKGINVFFTGLPDCLVKYPGLRDSLGLKEKNILYISEVFEDKFYQTEPWQKYVKFKKCLECSRYKTCPGVYVGYKRIGAENDIKPIR